MRSVPCISVFTLLCLAMSATSGAQEKKLSGDEVPTDKGVLVIHSINHASFLMQFDGKTIYADPVGGAKPYTGLPKPDLVLVTHIHWRSLRSGDPRRRWCPPEVADRHLASEDVAEKIPEALKGRTKVKVIANGEKVRGEGIAIEAVPAYNMTPGKEKFHPKGRDNGYVLTIGGKRVYIAGDTEDVPEMRALKGIDVAFLPMNLPYTMSVEKAADAIRAVQDPRSSTLTTTVAATGPRRTSNELKKLGRHGQRRGDSAARPGTLCRSVFC